MIYSSPERLRRAELIAATIIILLGACMSPAICAAWSAGAHHTLKRSR